MKISEEICGEGYTLQHITENPTNFDILYKKYVNKVEVYNGDCYVVINSKTGKIGAYKKIIFDIPKLEKPKISKKEIEDLTGVEANLVVIPHINKLVWVTRECRLERMFDATMGKEIGEVEARKIIDVMKTDKDIGKLKKESTTGGYGTRSINNNQGAVFRDDDWLAYSDIYKAKASMEKDRPNGGNPWDSSVTDYDDNADEDDVNYILKNYEGVYYSGHGWYDRIGLDGNEVYHEDEVDSGLQTRVFVVAACYAGGNSFGTKVRSEGVTCVIGASGDITDSLWFDYCGEWADKYWDFATGNEDAGSQSSALLSRYLANIATASSQCDLDTDNEGCSGLFI